MSIASATRRSPAGPIVIEARRGLRAVDVGELWGHREVIAYLALRDLKARYKQSALGALWAILQPLLMMVVFAVISEPV